MFNRYNSEIHNTYHFKLIDDKTNQVLSEKTINNEANSGVYVADIGSNSTRSTTLRIHYKKAYLDSENHLQHEENERTVTTSVTFERVTLSQNISYNTPIEFVANITYAASTSFVGEIIKASLGSEISIKDQEGKPTGGKKYWSEALLSLEKTETTRLVLTVTLKISVSDPSGFPYLYDKSINSLLNIESGYFPTPGPNFIALSTLQLRQIGNILRKKIPTILSLPVQTTTSYDEGYFLIENPKTSTSEGTQNTFYIPATGSSLSYDYNNYNIGGACTLVYGNVGAESIQGSVSGDNDVLLPVINFTRQKIINLIEQEGEEGFNTKTFYFFSSIPIGCQYSGRIYVNDIRSQGDGLSYNNPTDLREQISPIGVGINSFDSPTLITDFQSREGDIKTGSYYSNYIFGDYWEPPSGTPVCPNYVYFNEKITNIFIGNNISCSVQGSDDGINWTTFLTGKKYQVVKKDENEINYNYYRIEVLAPGCEGTNYFVNDYESSVLQRKSYDPNVLCVGTTNIDFSQAGLVVPGATLLNWKEQLDNDSHLAGMRVNLGLTSITGYYKAANTLAYLVYSARVEGGRNA